MLDKFQFGDSQLDVIVTENIFGVILSDEASMITCSIDMIPSSSLCAASYGLYEPIHGSKMRPIANENPFSIEDIFCLESD
ncbi:MAG: hypothetical protein IKJ27_00355 [Clostridia bacterium]|nr:hypothetical protein [Clostridia bacterium]